MSFLSNLDWRFAAKSFDENIMVSQSDLDEILRATQMAPTSYGLQPFHVYVIADKDLQNKLMGVSFKQKQVAEASYVLVFCYRSDYQDRISDYISRASEVSGKSTLSMQPYKLMMKTGLATLKEDGREIWAKNQTYIALGFAMAACAELNVDSCPMEGFSKSKVDELLDLPDHLHSAVLLPIGKRAAEPERKKVRFTQDDLFTFIQKK